MAHIVKQNRPIEKKLIPKAEALELFAKKGQTLKCQLIQEKSGDPVQCYTMGEFVDFCLGPHLPSTKDIKAFKLKPEPLAVVLEGQGRQPGDAAHLRLRLLHEGGARPAPAPARGGEAPRPPEARPRARPLLDRRRDGRRARAVAPEGRLRPQADRGLLARPALRRRLRHRLHAAHRQARPLEHERSHRFLPGEHVLADRDRERRVPAQADELPVPPHDLQVAPAQLPRPAVSLGGARDGLPLRALGRAARPDARARLHAGRRAHLLPARPARGRDPAGARLHDEHPAHLRLRPLRHLPLDAAREVDRHRRAVAGGDGRAQERARDARARVHRGPGRGRLLRPQDRHQDQGLARARLAVLDDPGGLQPSRHASSSSTSPRTARRTSR